MAEQDGGAATAAGGTVTVAQVDPARALAIAGMLRTFIDTNPEQFPADEDIDPKANPVVLLPVQSARVLVAAVLQWQGLAQAVCFGQDDPPTLDDVAKLRTFVQDEYFGGAPDTGDTLPFEFEHGEAVAFIAIAAATVSS